VLLQEGQSAELTSAPERRETEGSISSYHVDTDTSTIRSCIANIAKINARQNDKAHRDTQRNRKISSIGSMNSTVGQAYYNLNTTAPRRSMTKFAAARMSVGGSTSFSGTQTASSMRFKKHTGSFYNPSHGRSPKMVPEHAFFPSN
jgi:hypothetical protein